MGSVDCPKRITGARNEISTYESNSLGSPLGRACLGGGHSSRRYFSPRPNSQPQISAKLAASPGDTLLHCLLCRVGTDQRIRSAFPRSVSLDRDADGLP